MARPTKSIAGRETSPAGPAGPARGPAARRHRPPAGDRLPDICLPLSFPAHLLEKDTSQVPRGGNRGSQRAAPQGQGPVNTSREA